MLSKFAAANSLLPLDAEHRYPSAFRHYASSQTLAIIARNLVAPEGLLGSIAGYVAGFAFISLITLFYRREMPVNSTTIGFTFLIAILSGSALWGFGVSAAMSLAATLAFDYFFLPPIGSFNIADPQDWVALSAFLFASVIGSHLSASSRKQARESNRRRLEVERLYDLSQRLLHAGSPAELYSAIPHCIMESFGVNAAALFLASKEQTYRAGIEIAQWTDEYLQIAAQSAEFQDAGDREVCFASLRSGKNMIGSLGISGAALSRETLGALGSLLAVTIERAAAIEHAAKIDAIRESEQLKSVVMDAITHDFRTPLTCIKTSVTALLADLAFEREQKKELLTIIEEECDRIDNLLDQASEMARLESGEARLQLAPHKIGEVISTALTECNRLSRERRVHCEVRHAESRVLADLSLAGTVLAHLIHNADLYSSPGEPIRLSSEEIDGFLFLSVADRGPGIDETEAALIFEKYYRGKEQKLRAEGTGMGLPIARAIVEAHGGTISVSSCSGQGSVFTFSLPLA